jgi:hypothetical protein
MPMRYCEQDENEDSSTYYYGWIIIMLMKESKNMYWVIAVELRNIMMIFELWQLNQYLLTVMIHLRHSLKNMTMTLMLSELSWCI